MTFSSKFNMTSFLELPSDIFPIYGEISNLKINRNNFALDDIFKIKNLISSNEKLSLFFSNIHEELCNNKFLIIKSGSLNDTTPLITVVAALAKEVFFCERLGGFYDEFETVPFLNEYSRSTNVRHFHTDFSGMNNPPDYVAIQCIKEDPKHPFYGRNQIAVLDEFLNKLELIIEKPTETLLNVKFPCQYKDTVNESTILHKDENNVFIKFHFENIIESMLNEKHKINGEYIHKIAEAIALNVSRDFVLEKGDIAIASNKFCFHRRGECSLDFDKNKCNGREIRTMRFWM